MGKYCERYFLNTGLGLASPLGSHGRLITSDASLDYSKVVTRIEKAELAPHPGCKVRAGSQNG